MTGCFLLQCVTGSASPFYATGRKPGKALLLALLDCLESPIDSFDQLGKTPQHLDQTRVQDALVMCEFTLLQRGDNTEKNTIFREGPCGDG